MVYNKDGKRLIIYFFYDKEGKVDRYVDYLLNDLVKNTDELMIVCNGKLTPEGRKILTKYTENVIVRSNVGFDVWAYKSALEKVGYDNFANYSEIIMMNFTIMGPLYPFKEMFDTMNERDVDFWGLTLYHGYDEDPFGTIEYGYIPMHMQSHFIAVRQSMLKTEQFKDYWKNMKEITSYQEAIGFHEAVFTKKFEDAGFVWDVYVDTRDELNKCTHPILLDPKSIIMKKRCPVFKRRSFFHDYGDVLDNTTGEPAVELLECIKTNFDYDVDMIYENILRLENQADIKRNLHLNYLLPTNVDNKPNIDISNKKIALVIHEYFEDLVDYCYSYALSMPKHSDIFITTDSEKKKEAILAKFEKENVWNDVKVVVIENRGRDVSALLVGARGIVFNYDYVCFMHDKKVTQLDYGIKGAAFSYKCFENCLKNELYVKNIINTFEENDRLGMLMPPPPNFGEYYPTLGCFDWGTNFKESKKLADKLGLTVKVDEGKEPVAPLGTMFWFRPNALRLLFEKEWKYEDFPKEPNKIDGTLLHAIERIYPFVVQQEGYFPAWVMNDQFAAGEVENLSYMIRELNKATFDLVGADKQMSLLNNLKNAKLDGVGSFCQVGQLYIPAGGSYSEKNSIIKKCEEDSAFEYTGLQKFGPISEFRWDPGFLNCVEVYVKEIIITFDSGKKIRKTMHDAKTNGKQLKDKMFFVNTDPQMYFRLPQNSVVSSIVVDAEISNKLSVEVVEMLEKKLGNRSMFKRVINRLRK